MKKTTKQQLEEIWQRSGVAQPIHNARWLRSLESRPGKYHELLGLITLDDRSHVITEEKKSGHQSQSTVKA